MKLSMILVGLLICGQALAQKRSLTLVNYETDGVKQWLPGTIIVKKGEEVEITLINNAPSGVHGFFMPDFKETKTGKPIRKEILKGKKETITFVADKEGLFEMKCHMHPAHVGGQILVLP